MHNIFPVIFGLFFSALLAGICWKWLIKPFLLFPLKLLKRSLTKSFLVGVSVGNKIAELKPKQEALPEGEVVAASAFMDQFAAPEYEIAKWVRGHHIKKCGYVLFRGYANHVERCFVVEGNTTFQKKNGKRYRLPNITGVYSITDESFIEQTVGEVINLIAESVSKLETTAKVKPKEKPVVIAEVKAKEVEEPVPTKPEASEVPVAKKEKALETYKGYLISYGKAVRHISSSSKDDADSGREIQQFRVVIRSQDGIEESIWGQDLLRAMKDAGILVNDMVEVIKLGKRQIGSSWKNLYAMNKVA